MSTSDEPIQAEVETETVWAIEYFDPLSSKPDWFRWTREWTAGGAQTMLVDLREFSPRTAWRARRVTTTVVSTLETW